MGNNLIDILFSYPKGQGNGGLCHSKYVKIHRKRMDLYFSIKPQYNTERKHILSQVVFEVNVKSQGQTINSYKQRIN
jgi:hypothetical protein